MRFLVDAQLPPALARFLVERGHTAEHVIDIGPGDATDRFLWDFALTNDAALITKDSDFAKMWMFSTDQPVLVWIRMGNTRTSTLLARVDEELETIVALIEAGDGFIELR